MGLFSRWFSKTGNSYFYNIEDVKQLLSEFGLSHSNKDLEEKALQYIVTAKRAEYCSKAKLTHEVNGKVKENSEIINLIYNPNSFQTFKEFIYQYVYFLSEHGAAYIEELKLSGFGIDKSQLINLDPKRLEVPQYGYNEFKSKKKIEQFKYDYGTGIEKIDAENIITSIDDTQRATNFLKGTSKTKAGELIFENAQLRLEADNILTDKPGGIGILSTGSKEMNGITVPLSKPEKDELHRKLKQYGVSKGKRNIILTSATLNYQALANPIKDWDLFKNTERDFILAASMFAQPKEFYMANAKYNDKIAAEIKYYSGDPLSTMESFGNNLLKHFNIEGEIKVSFEHLPIMQEKKKARAQVANTQLQAIKLMKELEFDKTFIEEQMAKISL